MKYGNYIVVKASPYESKFGPFYSCSNDRCYGVFLLKEYENGVGVKDSVEDSFKVTLVPVLEFATLFPKRTYYVSDLLKDKNRLYKEFDLSDGENCFIFYENQCKCLNAIKEIKENNRKHIYYKTTNGDVHKFFYVDSNNSFIETVNDKVLENEDGVIHFTEHEIEKIMFNLNFSEVVDFKVKFNLKFNSFIDKVVTFLKNKF